MATFTGKIEKAAEDSYPHVIGAASSLVAILMSDCVGIISRLYALKIDQAYSGVFGLATVLTGFLFTFYSFVITTDHGFIGKARSSIYLKRTARFTVTALLSGGICAIASLIMMVWQPNLFWGPGIIAFSIWSGVSVWSMLAFERAARLFVMFCKRHSRY